MSKCLILLPGQGRSPKGRRLSPETRAQGGTPAAVCRQGARGARRGRGKRSEGRGGGVKSTTGCPGAGGGGGTRRRCSEGCDTFYLLK